MTVFLCILGIAAIAALWGVSLYNRLVRLRAHKDEGASGISVQLKRRHDLIPNLVATAKGLAGHEKELLTSVTQARAAQGSGSMKDISGAETAVSAALGRFLAVAEAYPQVKSDSAFNKLMADLGKIEDDIQLARRYYNGTVRDYNIAVESFPAVLIAKSLGFSKAEMFELESDKEAEVPQVEF